MKSKNKNKKLNLSAAIIGIFLVILVLINLCLILKYNVLPLKYLIVYLLLAVILPILIFYASLNKKLKRAAKIFFIVIEIIYILVLGSAFIYLNRTFSFLDNLTSNSEYQMTNYYVIALKDSKYTSLNNVVNKKIGYVDENVDKALNKLKNAVTFEEKEYNAYDKLFSDLYEKNIQGLLITEFYYEMMAEEDETVGSKTQIIYKFSLSEKIEKVIKEADVTNETFILYISGIDSYGNVNSLTRSDVNIIASINPNTNEVLLINIPRDYYVTLHGKGKKDKLTHAGIHGIDMSIHTIEDLLDIEINYYLRVNYSALQKLVDALGGVDVYSNYSFNTVGTGYNYSFKKGYNHVNGMQALQFSRTRKAFKYGDRVRGENQQAIIEAIIKKSCSKAILTKYTDILDALNGSFATNMETNDITKLINMQLDKMPSWDIKSISLSGSDAYDYTYSSPSALRYVMVPDEKTVENAKNALKEMKEE